MDKYIIGTYETYGREPVIRLMPDGSLVCFSLSGGPTEPHNDNAVFITHSYDGGRTWTKREKTFFNKSRACWATELCTLFDVPTAFVHTYNAETHYLELMTFISKSYDNGQSWEYPISADGLHGVSVRQGIKMSNGEVLFPVYYQKAINGFFESPDSGHCWPFVCSAAITKDGNSFEQYGALSNGAHNLWEPNAVEIENGHIIMYMRNDSEHLFISESFDYGRTWSDPKKSEISNSNTKVSLLKVKNKIIMINNFRCGTLKGMSERTNLAVAVSDNGKDFKQVLFPEPIDEVWFYPHGFSDDKAEKLYLVYENAKEHRLAVIDYKELRL